MNCDGTIYAAWVWNRGTYDIREDEWNDAIIAWYILNKTEEWNAGEAEAV